VIDTSRVQWFRVPACRGWRPKWPLAAKKFVVYPRHLCFPRTRLLEHDYNLFFFQRTPREWHIPPKVDLYGPSLPCHQLEKGGHCGGQRSQWQVPKLPAWARNSIHSSWSGHLEQQTTSWHEARFKEPFRRWSTPGGRLGMEWSCFKVDLASSSAVQRALRLSFGLYNRSRPLKIIWVVFNGAKKSKRGYHNYRSTVPGLFTYRLTTNS
jgi:hypothetical protein